MQEHYLLIAIAVYIVFTLLVGVYASRFVKSAADFAVAGKRLPLFLSATTLFATWFGAETILGATAEFVEKGVMGIIEEPFGAALCLFLIGSFFARRLYAMNVLTFGDYFRTRYSPRVELVSSVLMFLSFLGWVAAQFVAWGIMLASITGISTQFGILIGAVIILIYTNIGGMWAISLTDFIQTIVIVSGLIFLAYELFAEVGDIGKVVVDAPAGFFDFLPAPNFEAVSRYAGDWLAIGLGSIASQDVLQRIMAAKSSKVAVWSSYIGGLMYLTIAMIPLGIGLFAKALHPELLAQEMQMILPSTVMKHTNTFIQIMFFGALLSAIMSTASSALLAPSTVLAENLIKPYLKKELTDKQLLRLFRVSVFIFACISFVIANLKVDVYGLASYASTVNLVALFVPLSAAMFWKQATALGAMLAMICGLTTWVFFEINPLTTPSLLLGLAASIAGMLIGSFLESKKLGIKSIHDTKTSS
jgi:SSS family transporter